MRQPAGSGPGTVLLRAAAMVALGAALGLLANALHPMGLPLILGEVEGPAIPRWVWRKVPHIGVEEARELWREGSVLLVDTRNSDDYTLGHIPRSIGLPYWEFSAAYPRAQAELPRDAPIVIYCYGSHCGLSMRLAKRLLRDGYQNLIVMEGGIAAWEAAGYPTTGHPPGADRDSEARDE